MFPPSIHEAEKNETDERGLGWLKCMISGVTRLMMRGEWRVVFLSLWPVAEPN
jgi:hypothetical protein